MVYWVPPGEHGGARDGFAAKGHYGKGASEAQNLLTDLNTALRKEEEHEVERQPHGCKLLTEGNMVFPLLLLLVNLKIAETDIFIPSQSCFEKEVPQSQARLLPGPQNFARTHTQHCPGSEDGLPGSPWTLQREGLVY